MDFFAMDEALYQRYMHVIRGFIKQHGIRHEGVLHNAIETLPDIWARLSHIGESGTVITAEEAEAILAVYRESDAVFSARFEEIFERCVGDPTIRSDIEFWLGGVHTAALAITGAADEEFDALYRKTEGLSYAEAARAYNEIVGSGTQTLTDLIDRCYNDLYK